MVQRERQVQQAHHRQVARVEQRQVAMLITPAGQVATPRRDLGIALLAAVERGRYLGSVALAEAQARQDKAVAVAG
jgi:hypothetical protein